MKQKLFKYAACFTVFVFSVLNMPVNINAKPVEKAAAEPYVNARCAVAIDSKTKIVLYEKDAHLLVPMASTTKIMTALVAIKYGNLDKKFEISPKAASIHGSTVGYKKGEKIELKELIYGLMLRSGNDAAIAISEGIAGSVDEFVKLMNEYAVQIGLCSTHFESPHGLDSENHYSTAYDLAVITAKARENKIFNDIVQTKDIDSKELGFSRGFHNINKILWQLPNANGVKTGYTGNAGKCLVTSVDIKNEDVIIVVLNSPTRWKETQKINDYVAKKYSFNKMFVQGDLVNEVTVENMKDKVKLVAPEDIIIPVKDGSSYDVKVVYPISQVNDSIKKGTKFGSINIYKDGKIIYTTHLEAGNNVEKKGILKRKFF